MSQDLKCAALEWKMTGQGKDYVECDGRTAKLYRLEGLMLAVEVALCPAHAKYFSSRSRPDDWQGVYVIDVETDEDLTRWIRPWKSSL